MNQVYFYMRDLVEAADEWVYRLNPFMNQVYFYEQGIATGKELEKCLNPFMNQVYFYRCPSEAAPGAGLRACLRELRPHGGKKVETGLLVLL